MDLQRKAIAPAFAWLLACALLGGAHQVWGHASAVAGIARESFTGGFQPPGHAALSLLGLACLFALAALAGRALLEPFPRAGFRRPEEILVSLGLGLGAFSLLGLALGLAGLFSPAAIRVAVALVAAGALWFHAARKPWLSAPTDAKASEEKPGPLAAAAWALVALLALANLAAALGPEVFYDSLVYHLSLPKLYLLLGRLAPTPHNVYAGVPFNTEMLYGLGMALGGEGLAKLIPWGLGLAIVAAVAALARRLAPERAGQTAALAAVLFYAAPMTAPQSWHALVELYWCFLGLLAVLALAVALERGEPDAPSLMLVGLLAGLTMGVKYNAAGILPILAAPLLFRRLRERRLGQGLRDAAWMALPALLVAAPWLLKNLLHYRNPVFPFFHDALAGQAWPDWRALAQDAKSRDLRGVFTTTAGFLDLFASLWRRDWTTIDAMGPATLMLLPWLLLGRWEKPAARALLTALAATWLVWAASTRMPRFFLGGLPLLCVLLAAGVMTAPMGAAPRRGAFAAVLCACLACAHQVLYDWRALGCWRVAFGQVARDEYLSHPQSMYPTPYFAAARVVNRELPPDAKVLLLEEARGYYLERPFIAASAFGRNPLIDIVEGARSPEDVRDGLGRLGVTHLLVNRGEIVRKGSSTVLTPDGARVFDLFAQKYLTGVFEKKVPMGTDYQDVSLYAVARPRP